MTIFTTFNNKMYQFSGKKLLQDIKDNFPVANIVIYEELNSQEAACELHEAMTTVINVKSIKEFGQVFRENKDIIFLVLPRDLPRETWISRNVAS